MAREPSPYQRTHDALRARGYHDGYATFRDETIHSQHTIVESIQTLQGGLPSIDLVEQDAHADTVAGGFRLTHTIGEGGMGKVYAAHQPVLAREVAIKRVRPGKSVKNTKSAAAALVHEAQLLARLEHPNVPPVHTLGCDASGNPVLVMKRVRGVTWNEIASNRDHPWWDQVSGDQLAWQLRVLIQVCNVIAYAHTRRILHRDIKLDNVMIGHFGETYVLDWGAAVTLDENGEYSSSSFSGTPASAAPEMVLSESPLTVATDVYLLGALLHELMTGRPRHAARSLRSMLRSAVASKPVVYKAQVPRKLAELCNRATHRDPTKRPPTAIEFRDAIETHLEHRVASSLLDTADGLLSRLRERRSRVLAGGSAKGGPNSQGHDPIHSLAIRCRFAYEQVLTAAPEFEHARRGLAACLSLQVQHSADKKNYQAARTLLFELTELSELDAEHVRGLEAYIDERERTHRERRDELTTQVQHALVDRLRVAEDDLVKLRNELTRLKAGKTPQTSDDPADGNEVTERMQRRGKKKKENF